MNSGTFETTTVRRSTRLTAGCVTALGLLIGSAASTPASAASTRVGGTTVNAWTSVTAHGTCTFEGGGAYSFPAHGPVGAPVSQSMSKSHRILTGSALVGRVEAIGQVDVTPKLRNGGLATIDLNTSGTINFWPSGLATTCGDANDNIGIAGVSTQPSSTQPTGAGGWLTLSITHTGTGQTTVYPTVYDAADRKTELPDAQVTGGTRTMGLLVPPRGFVEIWAPSGTSTVPKAPLTKLVTTTWTSKIHGVITPLGTALRNQSGNSTTRRLVALPKAVSCSGKARVAVTTYAKKKKTKSVTILVNGKTVKRISRVKRYTYSVKVPKKGGITIKAKIKPRHGKTRVTTRTYAPCG